MLDSTMLDDVASTCWIRLAGPLQITVHNDEVAKDRTLTWRIGQRSLVMWIFAGRIIQRSVHAIHLVSLFGGRRFRFCSAFGGLLSVHCTNLKRKEGL